MAKYMIEAAARPNPKALHFISASSGGVDGIPGGTSVLKEKDGVVTFLDRAKEYYKSLVALMGTLVIFLNTATPIFKFIPVDQKTLTWIVAAVTAISVFLKRNETWVEEL